MRSRIFPAQISEADIKHFGDISETEMRRRHGGWGVHGNAYGKGYIHDVLAAVLHTATDVYDSMKNISMANI